MNINEAKSGVMFLSSRANNLLKWEVKYNIENNGISGIRIVSEYKYLGINMRKNLN